MNYKTVHTQPSSNQLTACQFNHCDQSVKHRLQSFSSQGGPFK